MHERRDRVAVLAHERDDPPGAIPTAARRGPGLVDPPVAAADAVGDLETGIAERARERRAQRLWLVAAAEIDDQAGDRRTASNRPSSRSAARPTAVGATATSYAHTAAASAIGAGDPHDRRDHERAADEQARGQRTGTGAPLTPARRGDATRRRDHRCKSTIVGHVGPRDARALARRRTRPRPARPRRAIAGAATG